MRRPLLLTPALTVTGIAVTGITVAGIAVAAALAAAKDPATRGGAPRSAAASAPRTAAIRSADARLSRGATRTILRLPRIGRWTAACGADGRVAITFTADHLLATSDLVVSRTAGAPLGRRLDPGDAVTPDPAADVLSQRWQIAPFAAAQVQVTSATVAARRIGEGGTGHACAASVVAVTGPDQGATQTG